MLKNYNALAIFIIFVYLLSYVNSRKCIVESHNNKKSKSNLDSIDNNEIIKI